MPRARNSSIVEAISARARPRFRHGRRTEMFSTQPRFAPNRSF